MPAQEGEQWYLIALSSCPLHWKCSIQDPPVLSDVVNRAVALKMEGLHGQELGDSWTAVLLKLSEGSKKTVVDVLLSF